MLSQAYGAHERFMCVRVDVVLPDFCVIIAESEQCMLAGLIRSSLARFSRLKPTLRTTVPPTPHHFQNQLKIRKVSINDVASNAHLSVVLHAPFIENLVHVLFQATGALRKSGCIDACLGTIYLMVVLVPKNVMTLRTGGTAESVGIFGRSRENRLAVLFVGKDARTRTKTLLIGAALEAFAASRTSHKSVFDCP